MTVRRRVVHHSCCRRRSAGSRGLLSTKAGRKILGDQRMRERGTRLGVREGSRSDRGNERIVYPEVAWRTSGNRPDSGYADPEKTALQRQSPGLRERYLKHDINDAIVTKYNPLALEAHRIGNTTAVIDLFEGPKVPRAALLKCGLYKKHHEVCKCCGKVGHRIDVCPNPEAKVCFACGAANPNTEHEATCKPRCKLCGGAHPTGERACKNKFKVPFVVTKRQWERKAEEQQQQQKERLPNASDFPPWHARRESRRRSESRQRSASRGRNASRRRTPSQRGEKITWTEVAKGASSGKTPSVTQRQGNEEPVTRSEAIEIIKANNEKIHAKLKEHDEMIKRINEKLAILLEALVASKPPESQEPRREPTPPNEPREEKREVVTEEEAARSSTDGDNGRPTEPSHKKRVVENTKERRLQARLDRMDEEREQLARTMNEKFNKLDERLTSVEQSMQGIQNGMVQLQAQIQSVMQNVEVQIIAKLQQLWTQHQATSQPQPQ
ncbi:uncharacterized protein LOC144153303 [Haemaphysalis longicornis]